MYFCLLGDTTPTENSKLFRKTVNSFYRLEKSFELPFEMDHAWHDHLRSMFLTCEMLDVESELNYVSDGQTGKSSK